MQFAVVDIETTGGYAAENGITEIAVLVTDGSNVVDTYYRLLDPQVPIPSFIESLTGITNDDVKGQPVFGDIAAELFEVLRGRIFVAHNVNFDYSFVNYHLKSNGYYLDSRKLCTIRAGRIAFPGLKGYGLDKICNHLNITIENRHSAMGDASATTKLLHLILAKVGLDVVQRLMKSSGTMSLPPNVSRDDVKSLPARPGVYFFHDKKGKVIYVGKAVNIKKRVVSHFSNNKPNLQKQEFLKTIYHISYQETATELMAIVTEGIEIKKRWPRYNKSQKHYEQLYGLYTYVDSAGYRRLFIEKNLKHTEPLYSFNHLTEGYSLLNKLITSYNLCSAMCFMTIRKGKAPLDCCNGACSGKESAASYNKRVELCIAELTSNLPSFAVVDKGRSPGEKSCVLIENGRFAGMGYVRSQLGSSIDELKSQLTACADNTYVRSHIFRYAEKNPHQIFSFPGINSRSSDPNSLRLMGLAPRDAM